MSDLFSRHIDRLKICVDRAETRREVDVMFMALEAALAAALTHRRNPAGALVRLRDELTHHAVQRDRAARVQLEGQVHA